MGPHCRSSHFHPSVRRCSGLEVVDLAQCAAEAAAEDHADELDEGDAAGHGHQVDEVLLRKVDQGVSASLVVNLVLGYAHQPHVPHGRLALHGLWPGDLAARRRDVELGEPRCQRHPADDVSLGARDADLWRVVEIPEAVENGARPVLGALGAAASQLVPTLCFAVEPSRWASLTPHDFVNTFFMLS